MTLTPEIIAIILLDSLFVFLSLVALWIAIPIARFWDSTSRNALQYALQKKTHLVALIVKFIFAMKLPLLLFFIYTCDTLSHIITGAMCASGVINSVDFGFYVMFFKLFNLYLFGFWLLLNAKDNRDEKRSYTRLKSILFLLFCLFLWGEIALELLFFGALNISKIVSCCGTLFSVASSSALSEILRVDERLWMGLFYALYIGLLVAYRFRVRALFISLNALFLGSSLIALIAFFSPYVYELPTHHCPFCWLQHEYYFIGYPLFSALFFGTFYGTSGLVFEMVTRAHEERMWRYSLVANSLYVLGVSYFPLSYFLYNGVWL